MPGWLWQEPWPITALYCAVTRNKYQTLEPISGLCSVNESLYQFVCFECNRMTFWLNHMVVVVLKAFPSQAFSLICFPGGKLKYPNDPNGKRSLCQIKLSVQLEKQKEKCIKNVSRFVFSNSCSTAAAGQHSNPCVCSQNEMAHFPQRKSQDHCHW